MKILFRHMTTWWRHQMEKFSAWLAICAGNSPVTGEFPAQRPVTRIFEVFFDLRLNNRLTKQSWDWRFETLSRPLWRHHNESRPRWYDIAVSVVVNCDISKTIVLGYHSIWLNHDRNPSPCLHATPYACVCVCVGMCICIYVCMYVYPFGWNSAALITQYKDVPRRVNDMASKINSNSTVYSTAFSSLWQCKYQRYTLLALCQGINNS